MHVDEEEQIQAKDLTEPSSTEVTNSPEQSQVIVKQLLEKEENKVAQIKNTDKHEKEIMEENITTEQKSDSENKENFIKEEETYEAEYIGPNDKEVSETMKVKKVKKVFKKSPKGSETPEVAETATEQQIDDILQEKKDVEPLESGDQIEVVQRKFEGQHKISQNIPEPGNVVKDDISEDSTPSSIKKMEVADIKNQLSDEELPKEEESASKKKTKVKRLVKKELTKTTDDNNTTPQEHGEIDSDEESDNGEKLETEKTMETEKGSGNFGAESKTSTEELDHTENTSGMEQDTSEKEGSAGLNQQKIKKVTKVKKQSKKKHLPPNEPTGNPYEGPSRESDADGSIGTEQETYQVDSGTDQVEVYTTDSENVFKSSEDEMYIKRGQQPLADEKEKNNTSTKEGPQEKITVENHVKKGDVPQAPTLGGKKQAKENMMEVEEQAQKEQMKTILDVQEKTTKRESSLTPPILIEEPSVYMPSTQQYTMIVRYKSDTKCKVRWFFKQTVIKDASNMKIVHEKHENYNESRLEIMVRTHFARHLNIEENCFLMFPVTGFV